MGFSQIRVIFLFFVGLMIYGKLGFSADAYNKDFTICLASDLATLDPYEQWTVGSHTISSYIFNPLFRPDRYGHLESVLVEKNEIESEHSWLFTLKKGVKFHDGSELTSDDVVASLLHIAKASQSNAIYKELIPERINRYQLRITTLKVVPSLSEKLADSFIMKKEVLDTNPAFFNAREMAIGTGPYRLIAHTGVQKFQFEAFQQYHLEEPFLQKVIVISNITADECVQKFLKGEVDFVDNLTLEQMEVIKNHRQANFTVPSGYVLYLLRPDVFNDQSPDIQDNQGNPLPHNPLKDLRVRQAISKAIDREALVAQFYKINAKPAGQLQAEGDEGYSAKLLPDKQNIPEAKRLLAEAGYPQGFKITLYDKDSRLPLLEAIAKMLMGIGIRADAKALPADQFFTKLYNHTFSLSGSGYSQDGNLGIMLQELVHSKGEGNTGRYNNPQIDELIDKADAEFNPVIRMRGYRYIDELVMEDMAVIPLFFISEIWAIDADMFFIPAGAHYTEAYYIKPANSKKFVTTQSPKK